MKVDILVGVHEVWTILLETVLEMIGAKSNIVIIGKLNISRAGELIAV